VYVCMCAGEAEQLNLILNFCYSDYRRGEKIKEKTDRDIVRKGTVWEKNGNDGVRVLSLDESPDFYQIKIIGPDGV